jgi:Fur family ferric uptake transcriptional regulator
MMEDFTRFDNSLGRRSGEAGASPARTPGEGANAAGAEGAKPHSQGVGEAEDDNSHNDCGRHACPVRMSRQRRVLLEELRARPCHPTADQLYQRVRQRMPRISLGTVYRNLEVLAEIGEILVIDQAGGQRHYDGNPAAHYHVRCEGCGCVCDVEVKGLGEPERCVGDAAGFAITGHRLEFSGLCPVCTERQQRSAQSSDNTPGSSGERK